MPSISAIRGWVGRGRPAPSTEAPPPVLSGTPCREGTWYHLVHLVRLQGPGRAERGALNQEEKLKGLLVQEAKVPMTSTWRSSPGQQEVGYGPGGMAVGACSWAAWVGAQPPERQARSANHV